MFDSWQDKRTEGYDIGAKEKRPVNGVWQIVKVFVEDILEKEFLSILLLPIRTARYWRYMTKGMSVSFGGILL